MLSIILPTFNERKSIITTIKEVQKIIPSTTKYEILVVDDDNLLRSVLLEQLGFEGVKYLAEAATAADVFTQIDTSMPDLILLDVQLPDGNGFEICARLRQSGFDKPILMLTGQDDESDIIKGLEAGANDYIAKPMRIGELLARIKAQLRQYRASDDVRLTVGDSDFLPANKTVTDNLSGKIITLTEKETLILTGDQHTDHISNGQGVSRHSMPTLLYFFPPTAHGQRRIL